jgi:hypothetical protein
MMQTSRNGIASVVEFILSLPKDSLAMTGREDVVSHQALPFFHVIASEAKQSLILDKFGSRYFSMLIHINIGRIRSNRHLEPYN